MPCPCKRRKEEFRCHQAPAKVTCNDTCSLAKEQEKQEQSEASKLHENDLQLRNQREAELFERRMEGGAKKRRRNRKTETLEDSQSLMSTYKTQIVCAVAAVIAGGLLYWISVA